MRTWALILMISGGFLSSATIAGASPVETRERKECGTSICHGSARPWENSSVRHDEYFVWNLYDPHRQSFELLTTRSSQQMAARLGRTPATERDDCLACHASAVAAGERIGCRDCHGSGDWVAAHGSVATMAEPPARRHAANLRTGLRATDDPMTLARVCGPCHSGAAADSTMTHRLMAAGHRRLSFKLDRLLERQQHWCPDQDYLDRGKRTTTPEQLRVVGQGVRMLDSLSIFLAHLTNAETAPLWSEFSVFECEACHHEIEDSRFGPLHGLATGALPLNLSALDTFLVGLDAMDEARSRTLADQGRTLAQAAAARAPRTPSLTTQLASDLQRELIRFAAWRPDPAALAGLRVRLENVSDGSLGNAAPREVNCGAPADGSPK